MMMVAMAMVLLMGYFFCFKIMGVTLEIHAKTQWVVISPTLEKRHFDSESLTGFSQGHPDKDGKS